MWNYSKCIHVHVPKTGGNSVSAALQAAWRAKPRIERLTLRLRHGGKQGFSKARGIRKHAKARDIRLVIGQRSWDEHFSFAFVRNPWDLMVSSYSWWVSRAERFEEARQAALEIKAFGSFSRFMDSVYGREQINEQRGNLSDWICEDDGRILVDVVGRFDSRRTGPTSPAGSESTPNCPTAIAATGGSTEHTTTARAGTSSPSGSPGPSTTSNTASDLSVTPPTR